MQMEINPGVSSLPKVDVIEQKHDYIKSRSEYSNGFIMISEIKADEIKISINYNLIEGTNGVFTPDFNSPNHNFVDVK